jgi:recombination protein RecA
VGGILDLGVETELIDKRGSFYSYKEDRLGQGRENTKEFLREHPEILEELDHKIRVQAGLMEEEDADETPKQEVAEDKTTAAITDDKVISEAAAKNGNSQKELAA